AYKNRIRVGFNCTECDVRTERNRIRRMLKPPHLNGRTLKIQVFPFSWENMSKYSIDTIVLNGKDQTGLARDHRDMVERFLKSGGGLVEYSNLRSGDINSFRRDVFGLEAGDTSTEEIEFVNRENVTRMNYEPSKLFYGVASIVNVSGGPNTWDGTWTLWNNRIDVRVEDVANGYTVTVNETSCVDCSVGDTFSLNGYNFTVERIGTVDSTVYGDQMMVWLRHENRPQEYSFNNFVDGPEDGDISAEVSRTVLSTEDGNEAAFVVSKKFGRASWVSRGRGDDVRSVLTTAVVWSSGEGWWNFLKSPGSKSVTVKRFVSKNGEIYKTYRVVMTLWSIY
ncbi:MAG: hypothetical protein ABEJ72_04835, partial [Candidatus Aenigmatarchaeota archaeon]